MLLISSFHFIGTVPAFAVKLALVTLLCLFFYKLVFYLNEIKQLSNRYVQWSNSNIIDLYPSIKKAEGKQRV